MGAGCRIAEEKGKEHMILCVHMMRGVRCRVSLRVANGERLCVAAISSSKFEYYKGNILTFLASIHDFPSPLTSSHGMGLIKQPLGALFSLPEVGDSISSTNFPRISPVIIHHREVNIEAKLQSSVVPDTNLPDAKRENSEVIQWELTEPKLEDPEVADANGHDATLVINAVCGILRGKPWGSETITALENKNFSYDSNIVKKVLKSVPLEAALQFFYWLKSQGFEHDFSTYHMMIDVLGEGRYLDKMKDLVKETREAGLTIRLKLYRDVLYWCACAGDIAGVFSYWEEMKEAHIKPSAAMYTNLISVHAKAKHYEAAMKIYSEMVDAGLVLSPRTFSIFINHLIDLDRLDAATIIISKMKEVKAFPLMPTYAQLMLAYAKMGNMEVVKKMGKDLRYVCDRPGKNFWAAVDSLLQGGKEKEAMIFAGEVWPELSVKEREENIRKFRKFKEDEEMPCKNLTAFEVSMKDGYSVPAVHESKQNINFLRMDMILKNWDSTTASQLKKANIDWSNDAIYELLLKRIQKPQIAWNFFSWLKNHAGVQLDVFNHITMLRILSKSKKFSSLMSLLGDMQREGVRLSISIFNVIIKDCGFAKNAKVAFWVFECIKKFKLEPDQESYVALIHAYTRDKCHDEAFALFSMMQQAGYMPDSRTCIALIYQLGLNGNTDKAEVVFQKLLDSGGDQTAEACTAIIKSYNHVGKVELACQVFKNMLRAGIVPLTDTLRSMAWVCLQAGDLTQFQNFMKQTEETHSEHQKILHHRRECLMLIKEVLVNNLVQQRELSCSESDH